MISEEHRLQKACVEWFRYQFSDLNKMLWHTNNHAKNKAAGQVMNAMGVCAGVPDLMLYFNGQLFAFELKTEKGRQSSSQKEWQKQFEEQGGNYIIIRSIHQFIKTVKEVICK